MYKIIFIPFYSYFNIFRQIGDVKRRCLNSQFFNGLLRPKAHPPPFYMRTTVLFSSKLKPYEYL